MAFTTAGDLLDYLRLELNSEAVGDVDTNALWKDSELLEYISQAQKEFSQATECLRDRTSFTVSLLDGTRSYSYDPLIISIFGGYLTTSASKVQAMSWADFERSWSLNQDTAVSPGGWESDEEGIPTHIVQDLELDTIYVWPTPYANDTLTLYVSYSSSEVTATSDNLEIPARWRQGLSLRAMALAYLKHDALETEDLQRSMLLGQKWASFLEDAKSTISKRLGGS